ncbi:uncharacterized protein C8orf58 homolog isoform 2-T3 [Hipposideros larvatus]
MLGRRRVFAVEPLGSRDGAAEELALGCVVPGVTSIYRRIPDTAQGCSLDSWKGHGEQRGLRRQVPLLKLASQDSGVEMVAGDSLLATSLGLSPDSLDFEAVVSPQPLALPPMEPPAHLSRFLASRKLEQVLERSRQFPTSPAGLSQHHHSQKLPSKPECELPLFGAGDQKATKAEVEEAAVMGGLGPEAWACLPGQGLRYLEHLCLVLEQMAKLQQLHLQLQTQKPPGLVSCGVARPADGQDPVEEEEAPAPLPPPSHAPGSEVHGSWELLSQTAETGVRRASLPKVGVPSANPSRLSEVPAEPTHDFQSSQGHKELSHWNKVKVLLNRIRWKSARHPEPPVPPDGPAPRTESRDVPERSPCRPRRKTFMPSLVVKKQRAKNLSVC